MADAFTVVVETARGAFEELEHAKIEAMRLAWLNEPTPVMVEDKDGFVILSFFVKDGGMKMTEVKYRTLTVDD